MGNPIPKLLIIGAVWPEPKSSAGGTRLMQLIQLFLKQNWEITYASAALENEFSSDLQSLGIQKEKVNINDSAFDIFVKSLLPDVVIFDRFMVEEQFGWRVFENSPNAIRIIETIDLHCLRLARQEQLKSSATLNDILLTSEIAKREIAAIYRSDFSLMISEAEINILQDVFKIPDQLLFYLPYQIPTLNDSKLPNFEERENFITIGNFKHQPNWDSVKYLKEIIFPIIKQKMPSAKLMVYGSYADAKVLQLNNQKDGFCILGRAEDAMEVMKNAKVCLAPLRFGAGIKGKLAEAMICGTPSVTTKIGEEGMNGDFEWNGVVTDNPEGFATAAVELYQNKTVWEKAQSNGFKICKEHFATSNSEKLLLDKIQQIQSNLNNLRQQNFIGSLLMHHSHQSTKYMSRWIEEKNRVS